MTGPTAAASYHTATGPQLFQTFYHGPFSAFEGACLRSFVDHGHHVRVYSYDHATTPDFCERADARALLPEDSVFCYRKCGFGAGSVSAFSNLFRYTLLLRHGGWWIDTDVACLAAAWPDGDIVAAPEDDQRIGTAVLRFPPGHPMMAEAVAACVAAGRDVTWGQTGPNLLTRLMRDHGLTASLQPGGLFYPVHWSEWLDLIDPACGDAVAAHAAGAVALHIWNEKFRHHGFHRALAPPEGSFLHRLATRHGGVGHFVAAEAPVLARQIARAREAQQAEAEAQVRACAVPATVAPPVRRCVYTALTGRYEKLTEQKVAPQSSIPFICFTDDPDLVSDTWQIRRLELLFPDDHIRSQRDCKLRPHRFLPDFDVSLYIDNSVLLTAPPEAIFDAVDLTSGLSIPGHSYRASIRDEFARVESQSLDDPSRIAEQLEHYMAENPALLEQRPFWSAIMLRDHRNATMIAAMDLWFAHVLRYARRDQLSNRFAFSKAGLVPQTLHIDNFQSWFHEWPRSAERNFARRTWQKKAAAPEPDPQVADLAARCSELASAYDAVLGATTWRVMEPVRNAVHYIRNLRA